MTVNVPSDSLPDKFLSETVIADVLPVLSDSPLTLIIKDSDRGILDVIWSLTPRPFRLSKPLSGEYSIVKLSYWQIRDLPKLSNLLDSPLTLFNGNSNRGKLDETWSLTPRPFNRLAVIFYCYAESAFVLLTDIKITCRSLPFGRTHSLSARILITCNEYFSYRSRLS